MGWVLIVIPLIFVGIGVFAYSNGIFEINQTNLDKSLQNIPQGIQNVGKTAKNYASDTNVILRDTLNKQLDDAKMKPINIPVDDIQNITQLIPENTIVNEKPEIDKLQLEHQVHFLTNQYRVDHGLSSLDWDDDLANVARHHSVDMASRNYFSHDTLEGKSPTDRGVSQGYDCEKIVDNLIYSGIAENIFQNNLYDKVWYINGIPTSYEWNDLDAIATSTVDGWMASPGHRENILTSTYDKEGIGVEISSDDKVYITQNFC
ncbi:CAP domain-containing protein [Nitrosopumilus sp.]|uniref:CAP domain-containing protein n=1 Tax=Nitrosopumilus sp. TaxID=2024843 RepID=UPI003D0F1623